MPRGLFGDDDVDDAFSSKKSKVADLFATLTDDGPKEASIFESPKTKAPAKGSSLSSSLFGSEQSIFEPQLSVFDQSPPRKTSQDSALDQFPSERGGPASAKPAGHRDTAKPPLPPPPRPKPAGEDRKKVTVSVGELLGDCLDPLSQLIDEKLKEEQAEAESEAKSLAEATRKEPARQLSGFELACRVHTPICRTVRVVASSPHPPPSFKAPYTSTPARAAAAAGAPWSRSSSASPPS